MRHEARLRSQTPTRSQQPLETGQRRLLMADQTERAARFLVRAMYRATDGERRWWGLPAKLNDLTKDAIAVAVDGLDARSWR